MWEHASPFSPDYTVETAPFGVRVVDDSLDATSSSLSPHSISKQEAIHHYAGLPSDPILVYRTGTKPWEQPTGFKPYCVLKELSPVFSHDIVYAWDDLGPEVCSCLDSLQVTWTSVDVVYLARARRDDGYPILWIGVKPKSLSYEDAHIAAVRCQELLESYKITDIEVEFRESIFTRSAGPKLLQPLPSTNATAGVRGPLTPALGLRIAAARAAPNAEGTGALYISAGHNSDKVYILTTRHVVFPPTKGDNELYNRTNDSEPRREVILPGCMAFTYALDSIQVQIGNHKLMADQHKQQLDDLEINAINAEQRTEIEGMLKEEEASIESLSQLYYDTMDWDIEGQRVIGHIAYSPPITVGVGDKRYTEDWALIELDRDKIDWNTFEGNVMDLGAFSSISPRPSSLTAISRYRDSGV